MGPYVLPPVPATFFHPIIPTLPFITQANNPSRTYSSADANGGNVKGILVLVSVLLYLRPSCNIMQIIGSKLKVVSCFSDYNRSTGGWPTLSSLGYPN